MIIKVKAIRKEGGIGIVIPKDIVDKMNIKAGEIIIINNIKKENLD